MSGPAGVEDLAVEPGVEPDEVKGGGHGVVFQPGLGQSSVAGAAGVGDLDRCRPRRARSWWMGSVIATLGTLASVVATFMIRFGGVSGIWSTGPVGAWASQDSLICSLYPGQVRSRLPPQRASVSYGETMRHLPGGSPSVSASRSRITSRPPRSTVITTFWINTRCGTPTAGRCANHDGEAGSHTAASNAAPSRA